MGFGLDSILGGIGDVAGYFAGSGDRDKARQDLEKARQEYEKLNPTITAQETGPSAFTRMDPAGRTAQMDVLARLRGKVSAGGLDAIDRAKLAEINQSTAQAGRTAAAGAAQDAARHGLMNSATSVVSQEQAGQNAAQVGAMQGSQAAAEAERARMAALTGQANTAGAVRAGDENSAAAQDAIARFNANQRQGAQQGTFNNSLSRAGGIAGGYGDQSRFSMDDAARTGRLWGGIGRTAGGVANYFAGLPSEDPAALAAKGKYDAASIYGSGI